MTLTPLEQHDPRLRQVCAEVSRAALRDRQQQQEIGALLDFMYAAQNKTTQTGQRDKTKPNTVGLAAVQVGIMKQICAVDLSIGRQGYSDMYVLVNPRVTWSSKVFIQKAEGCVNFGNVWGITRRAKTVKVLALDRSGNELELKLTGWPAVLVQHEIDHLSGRLFIDRLPDPSLAELVEPEEYELYRKTKPGEWEKHIDMTAQAVSLPEHYQPHIVRVQ